MERYEEGNWRSSILPETLLDPAITAVSSRPPEMACWSSSPASWTRFAASSRFSGMAERNRSIERLDEDDPN